MSRATGQFIDFDDARKSDTEPDSSGSAGDQIKSGDIGAPEPDHGIESEFIEPSTIRIDADPDGPKRTRDGRIDGRTKQARATRQTKSSDLDGLSIKDLLIGIHAFGASMTGIPELEIDEAEGKKLGDAVTTLSGIYGHTISPKTAAWVNFAAACGVIYGPRFIAYNERVKAEKASKPSKPGPVVVNRPPPTSGPPPKADQFPTPSQMWGEPLEGF